jgi:hypothetical protein
MTTLTVKQLHERAEDKIGAQLLGRYRDLRSLEQDLERGHYKLSKDIIQTQIDATMNQIDTLEYMREAVEVYSNLSTFNRQ